jgi:hypothetical protein
VLACAAFLASLFLSLFTPGVANAYPWMIKHGESRCISCHSDPSGAGLLTNYGRNASEQLLRTNFGKPDPKLGGFLFGAVKLPKELLLTADYRSGLNMMKVGSKSFEGPDYLLMRGDVAAALRIDWFRASASVGLSLTGAPLDALYSDRPDGLALISREHWLGAAFDNDKWLVRAGRMNLPFGLRILEHPTFVRTFTRTNIKDNQQHGVSLAYSDGPVRGELMAIAGNFQLKDDANRERGYSGYLEYTFDKHYAVGVSSLVTHAKQDYTEFFNHASMTRQSHGVFARLGLHKLVTVLAEADYIGFSPGSVADAPAGAPVANAWKGAAGLVQVDVEPVQGLHFTPAFEAYKTGDGFAGEGTSWSGWLTTSWFFFSHLDARLDLVHSKVFQGPSAQNQEVVLLQFHGWL